MLTTAIPAVDIPYVMRSGVTTDPADPARGPMGAQNCGVSFFTENLTQLGHSYFRADVRCHE